MQNIENIAGDIHKVEIIAETATGAFVLVTWLEGESPFLAWLTPDLVDEMIDAGQTMEELIFPINKTSDGELFTGSPIIPGHEFMSPVKLKDIPETVGRGHEEDLSPETWKHLHAGFHDSEIRDLLETHANVMDPSEDPRYPGKVFFLPSDRH